MPLPHPLEPLGNPDVDVLEQEADSPIDSILRAYEDRADVSSIPGSLASAMRRTTETGDIGAFSIFPSSGRYPMSASSSEGYFRRPIGPDQLPPHMLKQLQNVEPQRHLSRDSGRGQWMPRLGSMHSVGERRGCTRRPPAPMGHGQPPAAPSGGLVSMRARDPLDGPVFAAQHSSNKMRSTSVNSHQSHRQRRYGQMPRPYSPALTDHSRQIIPEYAGSVKSRSPSVASTGITPRLNISAPSLVHPLHASRIPRGLSVRDIAVPNCHQTQRWRLPPPSISAYARTNVLGRRDTASRRAPLQGHVTPSLRQPQQASYYDYSEIFDEYNSANASPEPKKGEPVPAELSTIPDLGVASPHQETFAASEQAIANKDVESPSPVAAQQTVQQSLLAWERSNAFENVSIEIGEGRLPNTDDDLRYKQGRLVTHNVSTQPHSLDAHHEASAQPRFEDRLGNISSERIGIRQAHRHQVILGEGPSTGLGETSSDVKQTEDARFARQLSGVKRTGETAKLPHLQSGPAQAPVHRIRHADLSKKPSKPISFGSQEGAIDRDTAVSTSDDFTDLAYIVVGNSSDCVPGQLVPYSDDGDNPLRKRVSGHTSKSVQSSMAVCARSSPLEPAITSAWSPSQNNRGEPDILQPKSDTGACKNRLLDPVSDPNVRPNEQPGATRPGVPLRSSSLRGPELSDVVEESMTEIQTRSDYQSSDALPGVHIGRTRKASRNSDRVFLCGGAVSMRAEQWLTAADHDGNTDDEVLREVEKDIEKAYLWSEDTSNSAIGLEDPSFGSASDDKSREKHGMPKFKLTITHATGSSSRSQSFSQFPGVITANELNHRLREHINQPSNVLTNQMENVSPKDPAEEISSSPKYDATRLYPISTQPRLVPGVCHEPYQNHNPMDCSPMGSGAMPSDSPVKLGRLKIKNCLSNLRQVTSRNFSKMSLREHSDEQQSMIEKDDSGTLDAGFNTRPKGRTLSKVSTWVKKHGRKLFRPGKAPKILSNDG